MPASPDTIRQIIEVLSRYVGPAAQRARLAHDLYKEVKGNKSVVVTLKMLKEATADDVRRE